MSSAAGFSGLPESFFEYLRELLVRYPDVESAVLFGSRAKGTWKNGSDVDVCLRGSSCTLDTLSSVSFALNETGTFPWKFDVVCSNMIESAELLSHIERVGIQVYARGDVEAHI